MSGRRCRIDQPVRRDGTANDEGSALILTLVFVLVVSLVVLPLMNYIMAVTRSNRSLVVRAERVEAVKAGLQTALINPTQLYAACVRSGRTTAVALAVPPDLGIESHCTTTSDALAEAPGNLRWALTTVQSGSNVYVPAPYASPDPSSPEIDGSVSAAWCSTMASVPQVPCGKPYPGNGASNTSAWINDASQASAGSKIFSPLLPPFSNTLRSATPKDLLTGDAPCKIYFPGKYVDDVVITGSTPVYFVSGVYYFEKAVRISGDADVVVGAGPTQGCADSDAIAVAETVDAPLDAYSNGVGGTFVFGAEGRFIVDTATAPSGSAGARVVFNRRLVGGSDPLAVLNNISIMSVNGVWNGSSTTDLDIPGELHVPVALVSGSSPTDPWTQKYKASTLIPTMAAAAPCSPPPAPPAANCPIVDFDFTTASKVTVSVPGYVAVPQGSVSVHTADGAQGNKSVSFSGGVLAAQVQVGVPTPALIQVGLLNPVVQKTFKITTSTLAGVPQIVSVAVVQVNETGGYAINSSVVQLASNIP